MSDETLDCSYTEIDDLSSEIESVNKNENNGNKTENMFPKRDVRLGGDINDIMETTQVNNFCDVCEEGEICNTLRLQICLVESCKWFGSWDKLFEHYVLEHGDLILKNPEFKIDTDNLSSKSYLLNYNVETFILHIYWNELNEEIYMSLRLLGHFVNVRKYSYHISLFDCNNSATSCGITFHESELQYDSHMKLNKNIAFKIEINKIKEKLQNSTKLLCKLFINILKNDEYESNKNEFVNVEKYDEEIMKKIECPVCLVYMISPIYLCAQGHSICNSCKSKMASCPVCRSSFSTARNYLLEQITEHLKYPCVNRKYHCYSLFSANQIRKHEKKCIFKPFNCPTNKEKSTCTWQGELQLLPKHIQETHSSELLESELVLYLYLGTNCAVIRNYKRIFKMIYEFNEEHFHLTTQLVGQAEDANNFSYKIEFLDVKKNELLIIKKYCVPLTSFDDKFKENNFISLPNHMLIPFRNYKNTFSFKYKIEEVLY